MLTFQYRGRYKLPGPADTYEYRLAVVANGDTVAVLNKIIENGGNPLAYRIENINIQPGGELTFVSNGTDMTRLDNIRWTDYQGVTGSIAVPRRPGVRAQRMGHRDGMLTVAQGVTGPLTIASVDGRLVARRACDGRTAVSLRLAPGAYIAAVSGSGRIDRAMVLAR